MLENAPEFLRNTMQQSKIRMQVQNFFTPLVHSQSKEAVGVNTRKAQYPPPPRISWLLEKHFLPNFINLTPITLHFAPVQ